MPFTVPLNQLSTADKLRVIEDVWADLLRTPEAVPSPAWHGDVLAARAERIRTGHAHFVSWEEAKRSLRQQVQ